MAHRSGIGSDEIVRMISLFAEAGRNSIDWAALLRIVAEHRNEVVEARRDRAIVDECGPAAETALSHQRVRKAAWLM